MAFLALTDAYLAINSTDLSDYTTKVELEVSVEDLETTAFGATAKSRIGGLKDGTLNITFNQDFADNLLDEIMWALIGTVVTFEIRPTSSAVGVANPKYTGSILVTEWKPLGNSVGELATVDVSFPTSGAVTRATA